MRIVGVKRSGGVEVANLSGAALTVVGSLADFWADPERLLAHPRSGETMPASNTPAGVGYAQTPPRLLRPGDVVEVEAERLGTLRNTIVGNDWRRPAPASRHQIPPLEELPPRHR